MKSYRKGLNNFIEYIFEKYSKDKEVQNFKTIYETHRVRLEANKKIKKNTETTIRISKKTADICKDLIIAELTKHSILSCFSKEYVSDLQIANSELVTGCIQKLYSKVVLERLKDEA